MTEGNLTCLSKLRSFTVQTFISGRHKYNAGAGVEFSTADGATGTLAEIDEDNMWSRSNPFTKSVFSPVTSNLHRARASVNTFFRRKGCSHLTVPLKGHGGCRGRFSGIFSVRLYIFPLLDLVPALLRRAFHFRSTVSGTSFGSDPCWSIGSLFSYKRGLEREPLPTIIAA